MYAGILRQEIMRRSMRSSRWRCARSWGGSSSVVEYEWIDAGLKVKRALIEHLLTEDTKYRDYCHKKNVGNSSCREQLQYFALRLVQFRIGRRAEMCRYVKIYITDTYV